jgi:hypothetical protein
MDRTRSRFAGPAAQEPSFALSSRAVSDLRIARVVNDRVGGVPVVVVHQPSSDTTTAFDSRAKGKVLTFQAKDDDASALEDMETHSKWDAYGLCVSGRLDGTQLRQLVLMPEFWFAWFEFHPQTNVYRSGDTNQPWNFEPSFSCRESLPS